MTTSGDTSLDARSLSFKKRLILRAGPPLAAGITRLLFYLNRKTTINGEFWVDAMRSGSPILVAVWHENALTLLPKFAENRIDALTSKSYDGELAARLLGQFSVGAFRGSSSRGGAEALNAMVKGAHDLKALGLTIDGPRGPRRKAKPGIAVLSMRTQLPILPLAATATKSIRPNNWDRTCIPKPFGHFIYKVGELIEPPVDGSHRDVIREKTLEVEAKLNALQAEIESEYGVDPKLREA